MQISKWFIALGVGLLAVSLSSARADDNAAQAAARAAVLAQLAQMNAADLQMTNSVAAPVSHQNWQPAPVQKTVVASPIIIQSTPPATPTVSDNQAQARTAAVQQRMVAVNTNVPVAVTTSANVQNPKTAAMNFQPFVAPALPISSDKQSRLQTLNAQYKAGQISPQDYFNQRENILNGM